jgi:hypothetical protein
LASPWKRLAIDPSAVGGARRFARAHLDSVLAKDVSATAVVNDAESVVSELVTNAQTWTLTRTEMAVGLQLAVTSIGLSLQVWDNNPRIDLATPECRDDAESGRGLSITFALSRYVDVLNTIGGGKLVRVLIAISPSARRQDESHLAALIDKPAPTNAGLGTTGPLLAVRGRPRRRIARGPGRYSVSALASEQNEPLWAQRNFTR